MRNQLLCLLFRCCKNHCYQLFIPVSGKICCEQVLALQNSTRIDSTHATESNNAGSKNDEQQKLFHDASTYLCPWRCCRQLLPEASGETHHELRASDCRNMPEHARTIRNNCNRPWRLSDLWTRLGMVCGIGCKVWWKTENITHWKLAFETSSIWIGLTLSNKF